MSPVGATPVTMVENSAIRYAGFWRRFVAWLLDSLMLGVALFIIPFTTTSGFTQGPAGFGGFGAIMVTGLSIYLFPWLYFALMESSLNQGTLGKMALGLRVTDQDGRRIGFGRATGRHFSKILSVMTLMIGFVMAAFTQKKQALHDFVAGTLVLSKQSTVPAQVAQNAFSGS